MLPDSAKTLGEAGVLAALRAVRDPDLGKDIVTLGFVKDLRICDGNVAFAIELTTPARPVKDQMRAQAEQVVRGVRGVREVKIDMTARGSARRPVPGEE